MFLVSHSSTQLGRETITSAARANYTGGDVNKAEEALVAHIAVAADAGTTQLS